MLERMAVILRDYQHAAADAVRTAWAQGAQYPVLCVPTGGGKTVIAAALMADLAAEGGRAVFLAPRRELVRQAVARLAEAGLRAGVHLADADDGAGPMAPIQVASIDTLLSRAVRRGTLGLPPADLVIVDEAHLVVTAPRVALLRRWPRARRLGLTATPGRKDGRALGEVFDRLLTPTDTATLTAQGHLVPTATWAWPPELRGVVTVAGDYHQGQLAERMVPLRGDIVAHWQQHAAGRQTLVYGVDIRHAIALAEAFQAAGVAAAAVSAFTPAPERDALFARFRSGDLTVLTNCFLAAYGLDVPPVSCLVLARPTKSLVLYLQMLGRGLRPAPGKTDCVVLDHANGVGMHGFATDRRTWTLAGKAAVVPVVGVPRDRSHTCPACQRVWQGPAECPGCGQVLRPQPKAQAVEAGELVRVDGGADALSRSDWYRQIVAWGVARGLRNPKGWAAHTYRAKFGNWPGYGFERAVRERAEPTPLVRAYIQHRMIAWSRGRRDHAVGGPGSGAGVVRGVAGAGDDGGRGGLSVARLDGGAASGGVGGDRGGVGAGWAGGRGDVGG